MHPNNNGYWQPAQGSPTNTPHTYNMPLNFDILQGNNNILPHYSSSTHGIPQQEHSRMQNYDFDRPTLITQNIGHNIQTTSSYAPSYVEPSMRLSTTRQFNNWAEAPDMSPILAHSIETTPEPKKNNKRKNVEVDNKARDLVFKGFSLEPDSKKIRFINNDRKRDGINDGPWSDVEHEDFLLGLNECGTGQWRLIADKFVKTRTRTQVASHAQEKKTLEETNERVTILTDALQEIANGEINVTHVIKPE